MNSILKSFFVLLGGLQLAFQAESQTYPIQKNSATEASQLEALFKKLLTADGHVAEELDIEIGTRISRSTEVFLTVLMKYRSQINRLDALVGNLGPEFVDDFAKQSIELKKRIDALETIADGTLKPLASECITELRSKLKVVEAPIQ
jgi:hypothetical protein